MDPYVYSLCGVLLGWVVRDFLGKRKLDPDIVRAAQETIDENRSFLMGELSRERKAREEDRMVFTELLNQAHALSSAGATKGVAVSGESSGKENEERSPLATPADIERQYQLATRGPKEEEEIARQQLLDKGLEPAEVDAILSGDYDDLHTSEKLDKIVQRSIEDATRVT